MEFAATVPPELKIRNGEKKHLLKRAVRDLLPPEVLRRKKMGFSAPERDWFRGELGDVAANMLAERDAGVGRHFSRDYVRRKIGEHRFVDNSYLLWSLFGFEVWHRIFIENGGDWLRVRV